METVTLGEAKALIKCMAHKVSLLFLSAPGVGKSATVEQAAREAGLECRSLLGTQIAPEDVTGIPHLVGERCVFCPPRILLPEMPEPFCLFLDELPACGPDVQKAFYSLLLERRLGEHELPPGTWVVSAGNRLEDRAIVRALSSALIIGVMILHVRVDVPEWLTWGLDNHVRDDVLSFIRMMPEALMRPVPPEPIPFSTPRAWASLSSALNQAEAEGVLDNQTRRSLVFGRVSAPDAALFCAMAEEAITGLRTVVEYLHHPEMIPQADTARWFVLSRIRTAITRGEVKGVPETVVNHFLASLPEEHRFVLLVDQVEAWGRLGAGKAMLDTLEEVTGI
jgi:hypothetical protein